MLFNTPTQFLVLALMLAIGFLFGLASHPGGKKWRERHDEALADHAGYRDEAEVRIAALERENAALRSDLDARPAAAAAAAAVPAFAAAPEPKRGWFDWGGSRHAHTATATGDDFTRIRGLDAAIAARLRDEGVTRYSDLASIDDRDEIALEQRLGIPAGFIQREQWREQAALLAGNRADEHRSRFG